MIIRKASLGCLVLVLAGAFASAAARPAGASARPSPSFHYLGRLQPRFPVALAVREFRSAGARVESVRDGMMIFEVTPSTRLNAFVKRLPCFTHIFTEPISLERDAKARDLVIARQFRAAVAAPARAVRPAKALDAAAVLTVLPGRPDATPAMLEYDRALRAASAKPSRAISRGGILPMVADDPYENHTEAGVTYTDNNVFARATTMAAGAYACQCLDADWYRISVPAGQDLVAGITFANASGNLQMSLYDDAQTTIAMSASYDADFEQVLLSNAPAAKSYYVQVYGESGAMNAYSLSLQTGDLLGAISGHVSAQGTAAPVDQAFVVAFDADYNMIDVTRTGADGNYLIPLPAGSYKLHFDGRTAGCLGEFYDDRSEFAAADVVTVTGLLTTANVNAVLVRGGRLEGMVTAQASGAPVVYPQVYAYDLDGAYLDSGDAREDGTYVVPAVRPDTPFRLTVMAKDDLAQQWWDHQPTIGRATVLTLASGASRAGIDFALPRGAVISGTVTDGSTAAPVAGCLVGAAGPEFETLGYTTTGPDGGYSISPLPAVDTRVVFIGPSGYMIEWFERADLFDTATPLALTPGNTRSGIDASLDVGGVITGRVTSGGVAVPYANVVVHDLEGNRLSSAYAGTDGAYATPTLRPGTCKVFFGPNGSKHRSEWYSDRASFAAADPVTVGHGATTPNIDADLAVGGTVAVSTVNLHDQPIPNVAVRLYDLSQRLIGLTVSDAYGYAPFYGLPVGGYKAHADPALAAGGYAAQWYRNKGSFATANTLSVTSTNDATANLVLLSPPSIQVLKPAAGETWYAGSSCEVAWTSKGTPASTVKIQLLKGTTVAATLKSTTANDGSETCLLPAGLAAGTTYRVKITTTDGAVSGAGATFTVLKPSITITAPTTGTAWNRGTSHPITWTKSGPMAATVMIQLFRGTTLAKTLFQSTANDGSRSWTIATSIPAGTNYKIKITTGDGKVKATSAAFALK